MEDHVGLNAKIVGGQRGARSRGIERVVRHSDRRGHRQQDFQPQWPNLKNRRYKWPKPDSENGVEDSCYTNVCHLNRTDIHS
jgi:hypothetical protein